ncbi:unnamed protein product (macronuclear) [Paramecium tetraurelia]|uniref:Peptidase S49 domain-containing protein n=1 Tax=Paramecium tetraurelia TaxID=5888 RepID=A0BJC9_PARTE|nr:uncharacterized protein GSPATT00005019001 [Paramecium tetraurelia]CAK58646.1 unnamed protein product [Paramecium tetraurelia]|eukprot:XP_001426044.1 hypothetical protein (macronuclear) [Paramecium tetraurelia strain d4-2]
MSQLISKIFFQKTVLVLRIQGSINSQLVSKISHQLENYNKGSVIALGLIINSQGGCPYQVEVLSKKIKSYLNGLPLYTFATEQSLGNAYQLLQLGNKSYAQNTSKIGFTQMYKNKLNFADFLQNYGINTFQYQSSQIVNHNFVVNSSIRGNSQQDMDYLDQYYGLKTKQVTDQCWTNRKEQIKINKDQLENNVFLGKEAKDLGLVDELGTYEKVLMQQYPKAKIIPINTEGKLTEYENWFNLFIKISQSRGFMGLVLLFGVKVMLKWGLIIYVWRQSVKQKKLNKQLEQQQQ